jgi:beta-glucanase (GH16 family)
MPTGDWLWPAIWMLPVDNKYGAWPLSGEIDLAESRGNNYTYSMGGNTIVSSALHWGPDPGNDAWWRTNRRQEALHTTYSSGFHTYGLVWTPKYLYTYIDTMLLQVLYTKFSKPFWQRGDFPLADPNGTSYIDPWSQTGQPSTPFDEEFYLIMNVAVGGSNGWFKDGDDSKPWVDKSPSAKKDFWDAQDSWYPTWTGGDKKDSTTSYGEMKVKSVKMWQQKGFKGC